MKAALLEMASAGLIQCYFSAAHITEMAPTQQNVVDAAIRRSDLLVELCGRHTLISHDRLFDREIKNALLKVDEVVNAWDADGYWFPEGATDLSPVTALDHAKSIQEIIGETFASRADRRRAKRKFLKGGLPRAAVQRVIRDHPPAESIKEMIEAYPMRPDAAAVLQRFVVGSARPEEAKAAFEASLRDPRWMMQWFYKHHAKMSPFVAWVRKPSQELVEKLLTLSKHVSEARSNPLLGDLAESFTAHAKWRQWQDELVLRAAVKQASELRAGATLTLEEVARYCPGYSVAVRSVHSAWHTITHETPRKPKPSDFADCLHAAYAPYVDVFRADGFMAPFIAKQCDRFDTSVVARLSQLIPTLEKRLR